MTEAEFINLIKTDIDNALEVLDDIFLENFADYRDLNKEYINPPANFSLAQFRSKLIRFVRLNRLEIENVRNQKKEDGSRSTDHIFRLLCYLDFKRQEDNFKRLLESRNFATFVIRGEGSCGQRWLLHQLIQGCSKEYDVIPQLAEDLHCDASFLIEGILRELDCTVNSSRIEIKCSKAIEEILKRGKTKDQFIIIKKAFQFINSPSFKDFYEHFLDKLNIRMYDETKTFKIVVFFVEETLEQYIPHSEVQCVYLEKINDILSSKKFNEEWKGMKDYLKIVCFPPISNINLQMLNDWLRDYASEYISDDFFPEAERSTPGFYESCCNGNPEQVMYYISQKLKYQDQWVKF